MKLNILVFDDSKYHRRAAELTLKGHNLTVVGTYDEAQSALVPNLDYNKAKSLLPKYLLEAGLPADFSPYKQGANPTDKEKELHRIADRKASEEATAYPNFDVVMTDLLVPASRQAQGDQGYAFVGKEMPLGSTIALLALTAGIKNVAVVTDMNHHNHPASAAFDCFGRSSTGKLPGVNILCTNRVGMIRIDEATNEQVDWGFLRDANHKDTAEGLKKYPYVGSDNWGPRRGLVEGKDWGMILKLLLHTDQEST